MGAPVPRSLPCPRTTRTADRMTHAPPSLPPAQALSMSAPVLRSLEEEAGLLCSLRHPNIVQFLAVSLNPAAIVTGACAA